MELTEFLLARIADDETGAEMLRQREEQEGMTNTWLMQPVVARVLAECDVKRQLVEAELLREFGYARQYVSSEVHARITARTATLVLRLLALPYADHPDYRQEWKP